MAPKTTQKHKIATTTQKLTDTAHQCHERDFRLYAGVLWQKILRRRIAFTQILKCFRTVFGQLTLRQLHRFHEPIENRQAHMNAICHVFKPGAIRLKMSRKLSRALCSHAHVPFTHATVKMCAFAILRATNKMRESRMETQHPSMQHIPTAVFLSFAACTKPTAHPISKLVKTYENTQIKTTSITMNTTEQYCYKIQHKHLATDKTPNTPPVCKRVST